jgi:hypothetical protein
MVGGSGEVRATKRGPKVARLPVDVDPRERRSPPANTATPPFLTRLRVSSRSALHALLDAIDACENQVFAPFTLCTSMMTGAPPLKDNPRSTMNSFVLFATETVRVTSPVETMTRYAPRNHPI